MFSQGRHSYLLDLGFRLKLKPAVFQAFCNVLRDAHGGGETGGPDSSHAGVAVRRVDEDLVVLLLRGRAQARVG